MRIQTDKEIQEKERTIAIKKIQRQTNRDTEIQKLRKCYKTQTARYIRWMNGWMDEWNGFTSYTVAMIDEKTSDHFNEARCTYGNNDTCIQL